MMSSEESPGAGRPQTFRRSGAIWVTDTCEADLGAANARGGKGGEIEYGNGDLLLPSDCCRYRCTRVAGGHHSCLANVIRIIGVIAHKPVDGTRLRSGRSTCVYDVTSSELRFGTTSFVPSAACGQDEERTRTPANARGFGAER